MLLKASLQDLTMNKTPCFFWLPVNMWHPIILPVKELQKPGVLYEADSDGLKPYSRHTSNSSTYFFLLNSWLIYGSRLLATVIAMLLSESPPCHSGKLVSKPGGKSTTETHPKSLAAYGPCWQGTGGGLKWCKPDSESKFTFKPGTPIFTVTYSHQMWKQVSIDR